VTALTFHIEPTLS